MKNLFVKSAVFMPLIMAVGLIIGCSGINNDNSVQSGQAQSLSEMFTDKSGFTNLAADAAAYYTFNNCTDGVAYDSSAAHNNGTINGAGDTAGYISRGLAFDGVDDRVNIPDNGAQNITSSGTWSAWVYLNSYNNNVPAGNTEDKYIIYKGGPNSVDNQYRLAIINKKLEISIKTVNGSSWIDDKYNEQFPLGRWTHVCATYDKTASPSLKLYVDGVLVNANDSYHADIQSGTGQPLCIGNQSWTSTSVPYGNPFNGKIDEVMIFGRVLDTAEIDIIAAYKFSSAPSVELPAGYEGMDIILTHATVSPPAKLDLHYQPVGISYDIEIAGMSDVDFGDEYAALKFAYNKEELLEQGFVEEFLVYYYDDSANEWKTVDRTEVNTAASEVTAYTSHFSTFVLTAMPSSSGSVPDAPPCIAQDFPPTTDCPTGICGEGQAVFTVVDENFKYYQDRTYFIRPFTNPLDPEYSSVNQITFNALGFDQALGIATNNADKFNSNPDYIVFTAHMDLDVYVLYDTRGGADQYDTSNDAPWLRDNFTITDYFLETTDKNMDLFKIYKSSYLAGETVELDGNHYGGASNHIQSNYYVILKPMGVTTSGYASDMCVIGNDTTPPPLVSNLQAFPSRTTVTLTWQNPDVADFAGVVIRRSEFGPVMGINDGEEPTGVVLSPQSYRDEGLKNDTDYYYTVFSLDINNNYMIGSSVVTSTSIDSDGDGLSDTYEITIGTNPGNPDTDGDGISDGAEVAAGSDPLNGDIAAPVIFDFTLTSPTPTSDPVITFTLDGYDDNVAGITAWMITKSATKPLSTNTNWQSVKPVSYTITETFGTYNLYAWAMDASGNVSDSAVITVEYVEPVTAVTWDRIYPVSGYIYNMIGIFSDTDGGYIAGGSGDYYNTGRNEFIAVKLDSLGNMINVQTYNAGIGNNYLNDIIQTDDGGVALVGHVDNYYPWGSGTDFYILKIDSALNKQWEFGYDHLGPPNPKPTLSYETINSVVQSSDGGFIAVGIVNEPPYATRRNMLIMKIDTNGLFQWSKVVSDPLYMITAQAATNTSDGGFIVAGNNIFGLNDILIYKFDPNGNQVWPSPKIIDYGISEGVHKISQDADGGYLIIGWSYNYSDGGPLLVKLNASGDVEWHLFYNVYCDVTSLKIVEDGYVFAGLKSCNPGDFFIFKTDMTGNVLWDKSYSSSVCNDKIPFTQSFDGGYIMSGAENSGKTAFRVIKLDQYGNLQP